MNLILFLLMGIDKRKAIKHKRRIPEKTLLLLGAVGGALGGLLGMFLFHHKTRKSIFYVIYIGSFLIHCGIYFRILIPMFAQ